MQKWIMTLILAAGLVSCAKMKEPVFKGIENVKMDGIGVQDSYVTLDIRYNNPNKFQGKLKNAEGDAWVDSVFLGHFFVDSLVDIPAKQDFLVPVRLKVDMKQLLRHSMTAFMKEDVLLRITGSARAGRSGVFRNFSLNYSGKQNLQELFNKTSK